MTEDEQGIELFEQVGNFLSGHPFNDVVPVLTSLLQIVLLDLDPQARERVLTLLEGMIEALRRKQPDPLN